MGACTVTSDTSGINLSAINPYRYRSYYYDTETGLYYIVNRYYDPVTGRFISTDKLMGVNDDLFSYNLFAYCGNRPIDRYDVRGLFWKDVIDGVIGAVSSIPESAKEAIRNGINYGHKIFKFATGCDTAAWGALLLMMEEDDEGIYHAIFDCWQDWWGYNILYDIVFDLGTWMESEQLDFSYNGENYRIWAWKGNYINLGAGAELGIYYGGDPSVDWSHWFVDKNKAMHMTLQLKYKNKVIISHRDYTWWITAFNPDPRYYDAKPKYLKATFSFRIRDYSLYNAFVLSNKGKLGLKFSDYNHFVTFDF